MIVQLIKKLLQDPFDPKHPIEDRIVRYITKYGEADVTMIHTDLRGTTFQEVDDTLASLERREIVKAIRGPRS